MKKQQLLTGLVGVLAAGLLLAMPPAADVYVSQAGNGSDCTLVSPCSFSTGMTKVAPGETVGVLGTITSDVTISKSGTVDAPITFDGGVYDGGTRTGGDVIFITGSNIVLKNAEVKNAFNFGIRTKGDNILISNVEVHHAVRKYFNGTTCLPTGGWGAGIRVGPGSENVRIENSKSRDNCGEAIGYLATSNGSITNTIGENSWSAVFYIDQASDVVVTDNTALCDDPGFYKNGSPSRGFLLGAEGYGTGDVSGISMLRNVIDGCRGFSFYDQVGAKLTNSEIAFNDLTRVFGAPISFPAGTLGANVNIHDNITAVGATLSKTPPSPTTVTPTPTKTATGTPPATMTASRTPAVATPTQTPTKTPTPVIIPTVCETAVSERYWFMGCTKP